MGKHKHKKKDIYCVDVENVGSSGIIGIENLKKNDVVIFFVSENAPGIRPLVFASVVNTKAKTKVVVCDTGKVDALDFSLVAYISLHYKKYNMHYIISQDTGYDYAIKTAVRQKKNCIFRYSSIRTAKDHDSYTDYAIKHAKDEVAAEGIRQAIENTTEKTKNSEFIVFLTNSCGLRILSHDDITEQLIIECFNTSSNKSEFYAKCVEYFGQKKGNEYYKLVKPRYETAVKLYNKCYAKKG